MKNIVNKKELLMLMEKQVCFFYALNSSHVYAVFIFHEEEINEKKNSLVSFEFYQA